MAATSALDRVTRGKAERPEEAVNDLEHPGRRAGGERALTRRRNARPRRPNRVDLEAAARVQGCGFRCRRCRTACPRTQRVGGPRSSHRVPSQGGPRPPLHRRGPARDSAKGRLEERAPSCRGEGGTGKGSPRVARTGPAPSAEPLRFLPRGTPTGSNTPPARRQEAVIPDTSAYCRNQRASNHPVWRWPQRSRPPATTEERGAQTESAEAGHNWKPRSTPSATWPLNGWRV